MSNKARINSNQISNKGMKESDSPAKRKKDKLATLIMPKNKSRKDPKTLYNKLKIPINVSNLVSFQPIPMMMPSTNLNMNKAEY